MRHAAKLLGAVLVAMTAGCAEKAAPPPPPPDTAADKAAIDDLRNRELAVLKMGNVDSALTIYTSDVVFLSPDEPMVSGTDAVRKWISDFFATADVTASYSSSTVEISGNLAVDRYTGMLSVTPKKGGKTTNTSIKGFHVLRKGADGKWLIAQDIWNADPPPKK